MNCNSSAHDGQVERSRVQQRGVCAQRPAIVDQQCTHRLVAEPGVDQSRATSVVARAAKRAYQSGKLVKTCQQHDASATATAAQGHTCATISGDASGAGEVAIHDRNSTA